MKRMIKKLILAVSTLLLALVLVACGGKKTVEFDTQGGSAVASVEVSKNETVAMPDDPTKDGLTFVGWYTDEDGDDEFNFTTPITKNTTLYAVWTDEVLVRFDDRVLGVLDAKQFLGTTGGNATKPADPVREGYTFEGWYTTKAGLTWLEEEPVSFPLAVSESTNLYAYWEPVNSKDVDYSKDQTYFTSLDSSSTLILSPLENKWSHESDFLDLMSTQLYSTEVDWDLAVEQGVAEYPGDFSNIFSADNPDGEFNIEALDYHNILVGATHFPIDSNGDEHLTADGSYDRDAAATFKDTEWTIKIRDDIYFETGKNVTAADYEYTLKQFLDQTQNNYRANLFYKTEENKNGSPIVNSYEYFTGTADWDSVGFEVLDDYSFKVSFSEPISQSEAVGFADNIRLVEETAYEASLTADGTSSTYGTPESPYVSYGEYLIKSWDENQSLVFNKNYDYVLKGTVNYKSYNYQIVDDLSTSVLGLTNDYYAKYAEDDNLYKSWDGYPQYLVINTADAKVDNADERPEILFDVNFRQALLYGFNRTEYATSIYAPNTATVLPVPLDTKSYIQDKLYYSASPNHLAVLESLGIDASSNGYIPTKAKQLFDTAYADWLAAGNTGKITIELLTDNDDFSLSLTTYVKNSYEELFGADKFEMVLDSKEQSAVSQDLANWDFDISLNSIGFGSSVGVFWQYPAIAFMGDIIGGGDLGLSQPYDASTESGYGSYLFDTEITIDLTNTYNFLDAMGEDKMIEDELTGHKKIYDFLKASVDEETGETKAAGIYQGDLYSLAIILLTEDTPFDGSAKEPFSGATVDTWAITAAFEEVFFGNPTVIPTVTRSSATVYADNVKIDWPAYSTAFGWGSARYRYLTTDPDFAE